MSSTLLFCDHICHGLRTLYDGCHVPESHVIAAMFLEFRLYNDACKHRWYRPTRTVLLRALLRRVVEHTFFRVLLELGFVACDHH